MTIILNIGLNVGATEALSLDIVTEIVKAEGLIIHKRATHRSKTENTAVLHATLDPTVWRIPANSDGTDGTLAKLAAAVYRMADFLRQQAIAYYLPGDVRQGFLAGPEAATWGEFDPAQFLLIDGRRLSDTL